MFMSSKSRRFRPSLDVLPSRLAPSGGLEPCPMDPSFDPWTPPQAPTDSCPLDPSFDPWTAPGEEWPAEEGEGSSSPVVRESDPIADDLGGF
jgi:hypothetical protein